MAARNFTPHQSEAITSLDQALCLVAGAGSGKTTVLVHHYLHLVFYKKIPPSQILVVTFTEKAAADLKRRLRETLDQVQGHPLYINVTPEAIEECRQQLTQSPILTLHGLGAKILRESLSAERSLTFEVLDEGSATLLQRENLRQVLRSELELKNKSLLLLLQTYGWKNLLRQLSAMIKQSSEWLAAFQQDQNEDEEIDLQIPLALKEVFLKIHQAYQNTKSAQGFLDFNDLEEQSCQLLEEHPFLAKHYQDFYQALLIDEFQDTSFAQERLLKNLLQVKEDTITRPHLVIVGDFKQSIYSFRGAKPRVFERFRKAIEASGGKTIFLSQNFRSPPMLVNWVNALSSQLFPQEQALIPFPREKEEISLEILQRPADTESCNAEEKREAEAKAMADRILQLLKDGEKPSSIFVLFRSKAAMKIYIPIFQKKGLPLFVKGLSSLFNTQEVLDCFQAFKFYCNKSDAIARLGLLRSPFISLSDEEILKASLGTNPSFHLPLSSRGGGEGFDHPLLESIQQLPKNWSASQFLKWLFDKTQIVNLYAQNNLFKTRAQNLLQFLNWVQTYEEKNVGDCNAFIEVWKQFKEEEVEISPLSDQLGQGESICLMTIHQSKGLDLDIVFLPDLGAKLPNDSIAIAQLEDGKIGFKAPEESLGLEYVSEKTSFSKELSEQKAKTRLEEEDRIFYVAITRTVKKLVLGFIPSEKEFQKLGFRKILAELVQTSPQVKWISSSENAENFSIEKQKLHPHLFRPQNFVEKKTFTITELECFAESEEEYHSRYILKLPASPMTDQGDFIPNPFTNAVNALSLGTVIHGVLDLLSKHPQENLRDLTRRVWQKNLLAYSEEDAEFESAYQILNQALQDKNFSQILAAKPAYSEIPFLLRMDKYQLRGTLDRLYCWEKEWIVLDYKTHLKSFSEEEASQIAQSYRFQLLSYCLAAGKMLDTIIHRAEIYFIRSGKKVSFDFSEMELKEHEVYLIDLMKKVNERFYRLSS